MQSFVINLDRSQERLAKMQAQFYARGLKYERVAAVDGHNYAGKYLKTSFCTLKNHPMTKFEIACFLSHRLCWKKISEGSDLYGAVFEDDVILSMEAFLLLKNEPVWLNKADILKIETYNGDVFFFRQSQRVADVFYLKKAYSFHSGAGGYILSKEVAKKLLELTESMLPCAVDHFLFNRASLLCKTQRIYQLIPALCVQSRRLDGAEYEESTIDTVGSLRDSQLPRKKRLLDKIKQLFTQSSKRMYFKKMTVPFLK